MDVHESPTKIVKVSRTRSTAKRLLDRAKNLVNRAKCTSNNNKERSRSLSEDDNSSEDETFKPEGVLKKLAKSNDLKPMDSVGKRLTKPPERLNYKFK
ncbi:unnamed protein product [Brachionus calyciflorus]|uniref:Uncharacterized protein n=1 Tax=Brachionus calyciflorus TaxID=104777 RepID=A0A814NTT1_9BILA|nr:unnamed protein product [Brachionus calyciflorus]